MELVFLLGNILTVVYFLVLVFVSCEDKMEKLDLIHL